MERHVSHIPETLYVNAHSERGFNLSTCPLVRHASHSLELVDRVFILRQHGLPTILCSVEGA
jgi:hypothetical protein